MNDDCEAPLEHESTANATWSRMLQGNRRFAEGKPDHPWQDKATRESLIDGQAPDAAVLACADSRVSPEIIFDQGLGDLFTVRTAGMTVDEAVLASLEYAVDYLHVSVIVVLGHEHCGAIESATKQFDQLLERTVNEAEGSLEAADAMDDLDSAILEAESIFLRQAGYSVWQARESDIDSTDDIERVHIAHTIEMLVERSESIRQALSDDRLMIVGARYGLKDGKVEVLSF